jgi:hypothetical protein
VAGLRGAMRYGIGGVRIAPVRRVIRLGSGSRSGPLRCLAPSGFMAMSGEMGEPRRPWRCLVLAPGDRLGQDVRDVQEGRAVENQAVEHRATHAAWKIGQWQDVQCCKSGQYEIGECGIGQCEVWQYEIGVYKIGSTRSAVRDEQCEVGSTRSAVRDRGVRDEQYAIGSTR